MLFKIVSNSYRTALKMSLGKFGKQLHDQSSGHYSTFLRLICLDLMVTFCIDGSILVNTML